MKLSVIIPAFNEEKLLGNTLRQVRLALQVFARASWETELIVCDNNSSDNTNALARAEGAVVVFEPLNQIARARNTGAAAATGDWFIFVDADSCPSPELFQDVLAAIQSGECLAGGSTVIPDDEHPHAVRVMRFWNWVSRTFSLLAGSFIFCEAAAFRQIGGFSDQLFASEELDLSKRLKRLCRKQRKRLIILSQHPLLTSARKLHLYTRLELLWFITRTAASLGGTLKNRESCEPWYDGRR
jgi:glycosyltransferase involved in cell wall biosynthesis